MVPPMVQWVTWHFANMIGIDHYYGMDEYGNKDDFDGYWAIWDEEFFQYFAGQLNQFPSTFPDSLFSVLRHIILFCCPNDTRKVPRRSPSHQPVHRIYRYGAKALF